MDEYRSAQGTLERIATKVKRFLTTIFFIAVIVFLFYQARIALGLSGFPSWSGLKTQILTKYFPCKEPLPYTLGSFATEFSLSPADFTDALAQAEAVWEKPSGLDLFVYKPDDDAVGHAQGEPSSTITASRPPRSSPPSASA